MKKITLLLAFVACVLVSQAQTTFATIGALRTAIDALNLPTSGTTSTTTVDYTLTGEVTLTYLSTAVTGTSAGKKTLYIQDATGAIMVYDNAKLITNTYAIYDGITGFTGKIQNYGGMYEIVLTVNPAAATSHNKTPFNPIVTTLDNLLPYIGQLVTVKNVKINDLATGGNGTFIVSKNYPLSFNGVTSTVLLRTAYPELTYIGNAIPTANQDITGLVLIYTVPQIVPRTAADFTVSTGFFTPSIDQLSVKVVKGMLSVENASTTAVEIYNAMGAKAQFGTLENGSIQLNSLAKGLYVVRVGNATAKIML